MDSDKTAYELEDQGDDQDGEEQTEEGSPLGDKSSEKSATSIKLFYKKSALSPSIGSASEKSVRLSSQSKTKAASLTKEESLLGTQKLYLEAIASEPESSVHEVRKVFRFTDEKPNFGGYLNRQTGTSYFHASSQTPIDRPSIDPNLKLKCRETQTLEVNSRGQQTSRDNGTQMTKIGVYVSNLEDKTISARRYVTAEEYWKKYIRKIVIVQKQIRCFLARKRVRDMRKQAQSHLDWLQEQLEKRKNEKEERIKDTRRRQQNPRSKADFNMLYSAVQKWRRMRVKELERSVTGPELKAALCLLGEKESQLLQIIQQHKLNAQEINKIDDFKTILAKNSASKQWKGSDGRVTKVYTMSILRAKQLQDLYHTLSMRGLSEDERLDALITLKQTVQEYDSVLTREIMDLADREADLLVRNLKPKNLEGLRQRILLLFMQYIRTPKFNPDYKTIRQFAKHSKPPEKQLCQSCGWLYSLDRFVVAGNTLLIRRCQQCAHQENEANTRNENSIFIYMLAHLRMEEGKLNATHSVAYLMDEGDFRYLVEVLWNAQSIMSAHDDLYDLVMCRWKKSLDWSPWNCVLLTIEEAIAHYKVKSLDEIYDETLMQKVKQKHIIAKNYFNQIYAATKSFNKQ